MGVRRWAVAGAVATLLGVGGSFLGSMTVASGAGASSVSATTPYVDNVALAPTPSGHGYWEASVSGGVFSFGDAAFYGSLPGVGIAASDIVGIASTPDGKGYWLLGSDGGVFAFGDAAFYGSVPGAIGRPSPHPVTEIVPTSDGHGYWMVASDGGVFSFGDAGFYGSLPEEDITPTQAQVAHSEVYFALVASTGTFLQPTADGRGYWIADSAGDVYSFGDAAFYGSLAGTRNHVAGARPSDIGVGSPATVPVTAFVATPDSRGYWMASTDGSVYAFGDAGYYGSLPGLGIIVPPVTITGYSFPSTVTVQLPLSTVTAMARTPDGHGYWMASLDGGIYSFGDAGFYGSVPGVPGAQIDSVASQGS